MAARIRDKGDTVTQAAQVVGASPRTGAVGFIVTQVNQADYSPAMVFVDELEIIGGPDLCPNAATDWQTAAISHIRRKLRGRYVAGRDFIIPTGPPVRMTLVGMVLREMGKQHRLLGYDTRSKRYIAYDLNLE